MTKARYFANIPNTEAGSVDFGHAFFIFLCEVDLAVDPYRKERTGGTGAGRCIGVCLARTERFPGVETDRILIILVFVDAQIVDHRFDVFGFHLGEGLEQRQFFLHGPAHLCGDLRLAGAEVNVEVFVLEHRIADIGSQVDVGVLFIACVGDDHICGTLLKERSAERAVRGDGGFLHAGDGLHIGRLQRLDLRQDIDESLQSRKNRVFEQPVKDDERVGAQAEFFVVHGLLPFLFEQESHCQPLCGRIAISILCPCR